MNITNQQILHPGVIDDSEKHAKQLARFREAVNRAKFLDKKEKRHWALLSHILTTEQLSEGERMIINEDLRLLETKQNLEKIKSNIE